MKPPRILGKIIYFFGYPIFRYLIKNSNRAYVLVKYQNKVLLTKNWLGFQKKWRLPGGGIKNQEIPAIAAARELSEEVGIHINYKDLKTLTNSSIKAKYNYNYWLFELTLNYPPELQIDKREILLAEFIDTNKLNNIIISEEAKNAIKLTI